MERAGQPNEVAPCYVFLASEDASYITGRCCIRTAATSSTPEGDRPWHRPPSRNRTATAPPPIPTRTRRLETYEQEVERASVESIAEHPEGSAPPLERLVDAHPEKQRK